MPRGWEDYWGRVRRVQYPTVIDCKAEVTPYVSDTAWRTIRTYEADLEFNIPTPYLQVFVLWSPRCHAKIAWTGTYGGYGRFQAFWNDVLRATGPEAFAGITDAAECDVDVTTQSSKRHLVLDKKYWRGIVKIEFQVRTPWPDRVEMGISEQICKAEVAPYQW